MLQLIRPLISMFSLGNAFARKYLICVAVMLPVSAWICVADYGWLGLLRLPAHAMFMGGILVMLAGGCARLPETTEQDN